MLQLGASFMAPIPPLRHTSHRTAASVVARIPDAFQSLSETKQQQKTTCLWAEQKTGSKWGLGSQKTSWWVIILQEQSDCCLFQYEARQMDARGFINPYAQPLWHCGFQVAIEWHSASCSVCSHMNSGLPGVINQTLRERKPQKVFLDILLLFAHRSVNSLHFTNKSLPQRGEHWAIKHTLLCSEDWLCICAPDLMYSLKDWWQLT